MKYCNIFWILLITNSCGFSQKEELNSHLNHRLIGTCEGCEAIFEYGDKSLKAVDTLPDFNNDGPKIKISGTVYQKDGKTPYNGTILYFYHTNTEGIYPTKGNENGWARRHGYIRGWIKTGENGKYVIYTLRPGAYPNQSEPEHIHITVLEPNGAYYWINDYLFEDDPLLTEDDRDLKSHRGGTSGIIKLKKDGDLFVGERDIFLGRNL